jgi:hypothetical protein
LRFRRGTIAAAAAIAAPARHPPAGSRIRRGRRVAGAAARPWPGRVARG